MTDPRSIGLVLRPIIPGPFPEPRQRNLAFKEFEEMSELWQSAYQDYETARSGYVSITQMDIPTPERVGTFGGAWECNHDALRLSLLLAVRRSQSPNEYAIAIDKAMAGEEVSICDCSYGDVDDPASIPDADLLRMPNGELRLASRHLCLAETDLLQSFSVHIPLYVRDIYPGTNFVRGRITRLKPVPADKSDYHTPGRCIERWIKAEATGGNPNDPANTLLKSYLTGWPICSDAAKRDACIKVASLYRILTECFLAANNPERNLARFE